MDLFLRSNHCWYVAATGGDRPAAFHNLKSVVKWKTSNVWLKKCARTVAVLRLDSNENHKWRKNIMFNKLRNSRIPIWANLVLVMLLLFMSVQVVQFYFGHDMLAESGITIDGTPNKNILYTTAGRLVAMIGASVFVLVTQNPNQYLVVMFMSILREGQEMFIDPLFPYANAPAPPIVDFGVHVVIVALEIAAFIAVYRIARRDNAILKEAHSKA
jgi:hypothetical protein